MEEKSIGRNLHIGTAVYEAEISMHNSHKLALLTLQSVWFLCTLLILTFKCSAFCSHSVCMAFICSPIEHISNGQCNETAVLLSVMQKLNLLLRLTTCYQGLRHLL